jgi:hypothetical protein
MDANIKIRGAAGWVALVTILAIIGGVTYYVASNDSDFEESNELENAAEEFLNDAETVEETAAQITARLKARTDLIALKAELALSKEYGVALEKLTEIRGELEAAYAGAGVFIRAEWQSLDIKLEQLADKLAGETEASLELFDENIEKLNVTFEAGTEN